MAKERHAAPTAPHPALHARTLAYARVSGVEQGAHGTSLASQEEEARSFCGQRGLPPPTVFVEVESGSFEAQEKRVELARLMAAARPGDTIVVGKVDRWSRDLPWGVSSVRALVRRGVSWFSITEGIDASTPAGDTALGFMAMFADMERKRIRERTVGSRQRLRRQGLHVEGAAPFGYVVVDRRLVIDEARAVIVRRMFELCVAGHSTREIIEALRVDHPNATGLDTGAIGRRLRDRRYLGESNTEGSREHRGHPTGEWRASHPAIVDVATWEAAQRALTSRRAGGRPATSEARTAAFMLRGMVFCEACCHTLAAQSPTPGDSVTHGGYYQCALRTGRRPGPRCERGPIAPYRAVDAEVERLVLARLDELRALLSRPPRAPKPAAPRDPRDAERARHVKRLANLTDAIADGTIPRDVAAAKVREAEEAIARIDAERVPQAAPPTQEDRSAMLGTVQGLRAAWEGMTLAERREAVTLLARRITIARTSTKKWERGAWSVAVDWRPLGA